MTVNQLINILKQHNKNSKIIFYDLYNNDLNEVELETIIECDNRLEITLERE